MTMIRRRTLQVLGALFVPGAASGADGTSVQNASQFVGLPDGTILVRVECNGQRYWGLLDTGASVTIFHAPYAPARRPGEIKFRSDMRSGRLAPLNAVSITFGGRSVHLAAPAAADLTSLQQSLGRPIDLVLGQDALHGVALYIDPQHSRLALAASGAKPPGSGWRWTPLNMGVDGRWVVPARLEGHPVSASFDLGSSNPLMVDARWARATALDRDRKVSSAATWTLAGIEISETLTVRSLEVAGCLVRAAPAEVYQTWSDPGVPVNIGSPVWRRFELFIDPGTRRLGLKPTATLSAAFAKDRTGLGLAATDSGFEVVHVALGSPAQLAGFKIGEKIVRIDDQEARRPAGGELTAPWRFAPPGVTLRLTLDNGTTRTITLAEFY